ncbi:hypothetical protein ABLO26_08530 [Neobacillus sp. 179-J 1A1 HS]
MKKKFLTCSTIRPFDGARPIELSAIAVFPPLGMASLPSADI